MVKFGTSFDTNIDKRIKETDRPMDILIYDRLIKTQIDLWIFFKCCSDSALAKAISC